jgi:hypothetical protein
VGDGRAYGGSGPDSKDEVEGDEERSLYSRALCASTHGKLGEVVEDQRHWGLFRRPDRRSLAAFLDATFMSAALKNEITGMY